MTFLQPSKAESLDDEQRAAVEAEERAIAVLAGPGSGKTRTLSLRARHLLMRDKGASALLLTFTNKAAAEMKARALGAVGIDSKRVQASTFHTFCSEVLRSHGELVGVPRDFEILDGREARELAQSIALDNSLLSAHGAKWSEARLRCETASDNVVAFGKLYQEAKRTANVVDFDDLVVSVANLFATRDDVLKTYAAKYPFVLVDEYQDTNGVQAAIVRELARHSVSVSIFADDDQAIYRFAGAEAANIKHFVEGHEAKVYPLTINYRSASAIVAVANALIEASPASSGRKMRAHRSGGTVDLRSFSTYEVEARAIAGEIQELCSSGFQVADIAVLARAGWRLDKLFDELSARGLPISDWRGETHSTQGRRLLAACLAAVRGSLNARQTAVLCALMERDPCGSMETDAFLAKHADSPLSKGLSAMRDLLFKGATPRELVERAQEAVAAQNAGLGASLEPVVESVARFEEYDAHFSIEHLLAELALGSIGIAPTKGGGIKLASIHRTKGLQWRRVYVLGLEEGHHPDRRSISDSALSEERRLCFVGATRAEDSLHFTYSGLGTYPSRFLPEMGFQVSDQ